MIRRLLILSLLLVPSVAIANDFGAGEHACWMHQTRRLTHGHLRGRPSPTGIEIIAFAPDWPTALRLWQNSPPHAALLPRCRVFVRCGKAWVGR
jgi:hypothetical protein